MYDTALLMERKIEEEKKMEDRGINKEGQEMKEYITKKGLGVMKHHINCSVYSKESDAFVNISNYSNLIFNRI